MENEKDACEPEDPKDSHPPDKIEPQDGEEPGVPEGPGKKPPEGP